MKKTSLFLALAIVTIASCTKTNNTTNTTVITPLPAFTVNGVHDMMLTNGNTSMDNPITVTYNDSTQETVTLSISAMPANVTYDSTNWIASGIPTYTSYLTLYDTTSAGATPGVYPMTITAKAGSVTKTFGFNLTILPHPSCTSGFTGLYTHCFSSTSVNIYTDSIYADPNVSNKVWFTNFANKGANVYATMNCVSGVLTMPLQAVGGFTYQGSATAFSHTVNFSTLQIDGNPSTVSMN